MPELPEIKIYAENLDRMLFSGTIDDLRSFSGEDFSSLVGRTLAHVVPYGKGLYFELRGGGNIYVHLMLTGKVSFVTRDEYALVKDKIFALKTFGKYLIVSDENHYAKVEKNRARPPVPQVGGEGYTLEYFLSLLDTRSSIKNVLTDQTKIAGLGNAYADEILYAAKVHPFSVCRKLPLEAAKRVYIASKEVTDFAVEYLRGAHPDMISGEDRSFFGVHIPGAKQTKKGEKITAAVKSGRKTYFAEGQELYE